MTENEFLLNIIELKKTKTIYLEEEAYKEFEGYRKQFESSIHDIKKLKKK